LAAARSSEVRVARLSLAAAFARSAWISPERVASVGEFVRRLASFIARRAGSLLMSLTRAGGAYLVAAFVIASSLGLLPSTSASAASPAPLAAYTLDPIPGLEYVAIAPLIWADHLKPLLDWKTEKGVPAQVFPLEYIYTSFAGRDNAERIHNFLADLHFNKAPSTKWLLLVGDGDWDNQTIPDREVFTNSQQDGDLNNSQNWYTTDAYYGNLESSWDENGNGIFGELNEGDWTPELYVGRVPVDNTAQLDTWVDRELTYERNPPPGIWTRRAVLAGALMDRPNVLDNIFTRADEGYDPFTDNARKVDEEVAAETPPWMDIERYYDYPFWDGGQYSPSTDTLTTGALKTALDGGASFLLLEGHGYTSNRGVAQYADPTGLQSIFRSDAEDPALRYDEVLNLTNGDRLPFVYVSACYAGDFTDRDDTSFEAFLKAPAGGAIAVVAGNGENFRLENVSGQQAFGNWWLAREFFHMLFSEGYSQPGKVLGDLKARYNTYFLTEGPADAINRNYFRAERVSYNLMGDPEFSIITNTPATLSAVPAQVPLIGQGLVQIQVAGRGGLLPGALVHISGPGGDAHATTNATGIATLPYAAADTSPFNITVTAPNHLPLTTSAAPSYPQHNLFFEGGTLTGPAVVRRNDSIMIEGTVAAAGLASYSNVVVEFRVGSPTGGTPLSALALPTVSPGSPRSVSASLALSAPGDYLVYATIDPAGEQSEDTAADNVAFAQVRVNEPPHIGAIPTVTLSEGGLLSDGLSLTSYVTDRDGGSQGLTYRVVFVSDPQLVVVLDGTSLSFEAKPGAPPDITVEVEASDGLDIARGRFTVHVASRDRAPEVSPVAPGTAFVGEPFALQLHATDPDGDPIVWTDASPIIDISPSGRIAFTPTPDQVGSFAVTVSASDGKGGKSATTFLLTIEARERYIQVRNPPALRAWPGQEIVVDLYTISPDPEVTFFTTDGRVRIDNATRTLHYTPAEGPPRQEGLVIIASKPGLNTTSVHLLVDVVAPPAAGVELAAFALAGVAAAALVGFTLVRAHQGRLRDEKIFRLEAKPRRSKDKGAPAKQPLGREDE
jgi:hypothetical protein